jgi:hypothetical protein
MIDERTFTAHAQPGWMSWDEYSPEEDFCRFVGMLQRMLQPAVVLETGVGVGRITGYLDLELCTFLGFESDPDWRRAPADPGRGTPADADMAVADLVILDSEPTMRLAEIAMWDRVGKPGSVCIVHDCGNGHPDGAMHSVLGARCRATGAAGLMLRNPRGGWVGIHR